MSGDPLADMEARFMAAIAALEEQVLAALGSLSGMAERPGRRASAHHGAGGATDRTGERETLGGGGQRMNDLYTTDTAAWSVQQAELLRRRAAGELANDAELDWLNIAEEIADVSERDRDRIYDQLVTALAHLLKWQVQPSMRSGGWRSAVVKARDRIGKLVKDSASLRSCPAEALAEAYPDARREAEAAD